MPIFGSSRYYHLLPKIRSMTAPTSPSPSHPSLLHRYLLLRSASRTIAAAAPAPESRGRLVAQAPRRRRAESQEDLDKALLSLSGGALGVSFVFLKDIAGLGPLVVRMAVANSLDLLGVQHDDGSGIVLWKCLHHPSGHQEIDASEPNDRAFALLSITRILTASGGTLFLVGVLAMTGFVVFNFNARNYKLGNNASAAVTTRQTSAQSPRQAESATASPGYVPPTPLSSSTSTR